MSRQEELSACLKGVEIHGQIATLGATAIHVGCGIEFAGGVMACVHAVTHKKVIVLSIDRLSLADTNLPMFSALLLHELGHITNGDLDTVKEGLLLDEAKEKAADAYAANIIGHEVMISALETFRNEQTNLLIHAGLGFFKLFRELWKVNYYLKARIHALKKLRSAQPVNKPTFQWEDWMHKSASEPLPVIQF